MKTKHVRVAIVGDVNNKRQYLKENGWWSHYHENCWFEKSKDNTYVNDEGKIVGFRPESDGISLEEAYKKQKTK